MSISQLLRQEPTKTIVGPKLGPSRTTFRVWAPYAPKVQLILQREGQQEEVQLPMQSIGDGFFTAELEQPLDGANYWFDLGHGRRRADPASRFQPEGIHGPSQVIDLRYDWTDDDWRGRPLAEYVIYELHVGAFTRAGDFDGVVEQLDMLADLGVTAIELLPVAQFPGTRNWGYDGVFPYAVQNSYGGPRGLQRLIDECHQRGLAVVIDVVYNHLGPEGNYFEEFGPYFTDRYKTPWGKAINFDGPDSDPARQFFIENALFWIREFHVDALRLDAIQMIFDNSARPVLRELAKEVHTEGQRLGRQVHVIGETHQNDVRLVTPADSGGIGLDAVWNDDFHHSLHALLTGERVSVYADHGPLENLAKAYRDGFVLTGQYSQFNRRRHGNCSREIDGERLIVFAQNHDQVGNRLYGERLSELTSFEQAKLAAAVLLLSPYVPMLWMGEEYAETKPFLYFVDHEDQHLNDRVRDGRINDHRDWLRTDELAPWPHARSTFRKSRLRLDRRESPPHDAMWRFHQRLLTLRRTLPSLAALDKSQQDVQFDEDQKWLMSRRRSEQDETLALFHFGDQPTDFELSEIEGRWTKQLESADAEWAGPGGTVSDTIACQDQLRVRLAPRSALLLLLREN